MFSAQHNTATAFDDIRISKKLCLKSPLAGLGAPALVTVAGIQHVDMDMHGMALVYDLAFWLHKEYRSKPSIMLSTLATPKHIL